MADSAEPQIPPDQVAIIRPPQQNRFVRVTDGRCTLLVTVEPLDTKQIFRTRILRTLAASDFPESLMPRRVIECQPGDITIVPLRGSSQEFASWVGSVRDDQIARFDEASDSALLITFFEADGMHLTMHFLGFVFNSAASRGDEGNEAPPLLLDVPDDSSSSPTGNSLRSQGTTDGLCTNCSRLCIRSLDSLTGHARRLDQERRLANDKCELCRLLNAKLQLRFPRTRTKALVTADRIDEGTACTLCLRLEPSSLADPIPCGRIRYYDAQGKPGEGGLLKLFTLPDDPASQHGVAQKRALVSTGSDDSVKTVCTSIRHCLSHPECSGWSRFNVFEVKQHPKRLLDLRAFGDCADMQLVDFQTLTSESTVMDPLASILSDRRIKLLGVVYATVSHCWGGKIPVRTTPSTLGSHKTRIAYVKLSKTFRDCADFARALGLRYLWIDALCIIQESPVEWQIESRKMGAIYGGASLNISADMSSDSSGGCFNQSSTTQDQVLGKTVKVTSTLPDRKTSTLYIWDTTDDKVPGRYPAGSPAIDAIRNAPLASRAWVCQESCLSQRILHFTSSQLVWECRRGFRSEDNLRTFHLDLPSASGFLIQRSGEKRAEADRTLAWYRDIVQASYSHRLLSNEGDRLPALSGLAKHFSRWMSRRYVAGIWTSSQLSFLFGLAWHRDGEGHARPTNSQGPSWSWTAIKRAVAWPSYFKIPSKIFVRLLDKELEGDFLGSITQAPICLTGYLGRATVWPSKVMTENGPRSSSATLKDDFAIGFESNRSNEYVSQLADGSFLTDYNKIMSIFDISFLAFKPDQPAVEESVTGARQQTGETEHESDEDLILSCYEAENKGRPKRTFPACLLTADKAPLGPAWLDDRPVREEVTVCVIGRTKHSLIVLLLREHGDQYIRCGIAEILDDVKMQSFTDEFELGEVVVV